MISNYKIEEDKVKVFTPFSWGVVKESKNLGGKFNREEGCWEFPLGRISDIEEKLGKKGDTVKVRVSVEEECVTHGGYYIQVGWYVLTTRKGRDSRAQINADLIQGEIPEKGGSVKNPRIEESSDTEFELFVYEDFAIKNNLTIISDEKDEKQRVISEIKYMMEKFNIKYEELK